MIDIDPNDIFSVRHTVDNRFVIFTTTDVLPDWNQRFWGAVLDTGGDGHGALVRYGNPGAPAGWTVRQLILVVQARMEAEYARAPQTGALAVRKALAGARAFKPIGGGNSIEASASAGRAREDDPPAVAFHPGGLASPYPWTVALYEDFALPLCPDPESLDEGVTPEQLLIVLEQMLVEWVKTSPHRRLIREARYAVKAALAAEVERVDNARRQIGSIGPTV